MVVASKMDRKDICSVLQNHDLAKCPREGGVNCSDLFLISLKSLKGNCYLQLKNIRYI